MSGDSDTPCSIKPGVWEEGGRRRASRQPLSKVAASCLLASPEPAPLTSLGGGPNWKEERSHFPLQAGLMDLNSITD